MIVDNPLARLPHGPEFRFVDHVTSLEPGCLGRGEMVIRGDERFLQDHFPGNPVVPGVIIAEALAQMAGLTAFLEHEPGTLGALAQMNVKFLAPVRPPARITLEASVQRILGALAFCRVQAACEGSPVCEGTLVVAIGSQETINGQRSS